MLKFFSTDCALVCGHRYYHRTVGGDAAVGRYAVGLKLGEPNHTVLPAHFHPADGGLIRQEWLDLCPAYDRYPEAFRRTALPFLLAVLIYHIDRGDFDGLFPDAHPYRLSRVFQTRPHFVKLKAMLVCGKLGSCDGCAMVASGTSVMASCLLELAELKDLVRSNTIGIAVCWSSRSVNWGPMASDEDMRKSLFLFDRVYPHFMAQIVPVYYSCFKIVSYCVIYFF